MTDASHNRRDTDAVINLISDRIDDVGRDVASVSQNLERHVTECTAMQKKLLIAVISGLGLFILKSLPIVAKVLGP